MVELVLPLWHVLTTPADDGVGFALFACFNDINYGEVGPVLVAYFSNAYIWWS